ARNQRGQRNGVEPVTEQADSLSNPQPRIVRVVAQKLNVTVHRGQFTFGAFDAGPFGSERTGIVPRKAALPTEKKHVATTTAVITRRLRLTKPAQQRTWPLSSDAGYGTIVRGLNPKTVRRQQ